jgi:hypothetical protein
MGNRVCGRVDWSCPKEREEDRWCVDEKQRYLSIKTLRSVLTFRIFKCLRANPSRENEVVV